MSTNFKIRKVAPATTNKYYIKTTRGGYNKAMLINSKDGNVIPNCTGLVHGRWLECTGITDPRKDRLYLGNAENYYHYTNDGYKRSKLPKVGAIGCYRHKSGHGGHVIFIESMDSKGKITFSESAYDGFRYQYREMTPPYRYSNDYVLQGFILNPYIKETKPASDLKVGDNVVIIATGNGQANGKGKTAGGIGWTRKVMKILPDAVFPYLVGLNGVATGWYKKAALKKKG